MTSSSIGELYDLQSEAYAEYDEERFAWRYLEQPAYDRYLPDLYRAEIKVLDIGCGNGLVARHFIERGVLPENITGIDPSSGQLARARQTTPGVTFTESSAESFELEPESVDLAVTNTVLHHLDNEQLEAMLEKVYAALKPGGTYFFVDVDPDQSSESFDPDTVNTWKDVHTPWGTRVPFFNRDPNSLFDALDRHGFDMLAGWPISVPVTAEADDPAQYAHYTSRPSRMAARFQKIPALNRIPRYHDVRIPNIVRSPEEEAQASLVYKYFKAWGKQSLDTAASIFSDDAVYDEKPGQLEPLSGQKQVMRYWQENPMSQRNIQVKHHIIGHSPDKAVWAAFSATFFAKGVQDAIQGYIKFETDVTQQKIYRLTEWFEHI